MLAAIVYHKVVDQLIAGSDPFGIAVSRKTLMSQVAALSNSFSVIDGATVIADAERIVASRDLHILFTFDDGYAGGVTHGAEILSDNNVRGVAFISPWHLLRPESYWWDELAVLASANPTAAADLREQLMDQPYERAFQAVHKMGMVRVPAATDALVSWDALRMANEILDIACHGFRHDPFGALTTCQLREDLELANNRFDEEGIVAIQMLAYPYGSPNTLSNTQIKVVRSKFAVAFRAGHRVAIRSRDQLWQWKLPRIFASERSGHAMLEKVRNLAARPGDSVA